MLAAGTCRCGPPSVLAPLPPTETSPSRHPFASRSHAQPVHRWQRGSEPPSRAVTQPPMSRFRIEVTGVVQGVGFRPTVWRLARELGLAGFVRNSSAGVEIEVEGDRAGEFADALRASPPPLARITGLEAREIPEQGVDRLRDPAEPRGGRVHRPLARHRHLRATACANWPTRPTGASGTRSSTAPTAGRATRSRCGCRTTARTRRWRRSRSARTATREYHDPADRRFHAQPNACAACGPTVTFRHAATPGRACAAPTAIRAAIALLRDGGILALKGLGGYQLACNALDAAAVAGCASANDAATRPSR